MLPPCQASPNPRNGFSGVARTLGVVALRLVKWATGRMAAMSAQVPPSRSGAGPASGVPVRGAVDLAALAQAREQQRQAQERAAQVAANPEAAAAGPLVFDATTANFQTEVIDRSFQVPVVVDLWATWCGPCKQLSPVLEKLVNDDAGTWVLAKVDVDAEQAIAQAFQVQSIPTVVAIIKGQPVPLFQGAMPEPQLRQVMDELIKVAAENGVSASAAAGETEVAAEPPADEIEDTRFDAAFDAFEAADWDAAEKAYRDILATDPEDPDAKAGLIRVELMRRTEGVDPAAALAAADADSQDLEAAKTAADIELLSGKSGAAFSRMIALVRTSQGDDRQAARQHLLSLFELVGNQDPDVAAARTQLANALF